MCAGHGASQLGDSTDLVADRNLAFSEMTLLTIPPNGTLTDEPISHLGEDAIFVLEGKLQLTLGCKTCLLEAEDSAQYEAQIPHNLENVGDSIARIVMAVSPPFLGL